MSNLEYYQHMERFGEPKWKESFSDYLDRYHEWMIKNSFITS